MTLPRAYEDQLVERAKQDADAFGELYDHYFGQIYRFVYSRLHNQEAAEDVTSEVFFKALRAIGRYRPSGHPFSAWLYQILSMPSMTTTAAANRPRASTAQSLSRILSALSPTALSTVSRLRASGRPLTICRRSSGLQ